MKIGIPREVDSGETRVAATPETVRTYARGGLEVLVEAGAGARSMIADKEYQDVGATIVADAKTLFAQADVVLKINPPVAGGDRDELAMLRKGQVLVSLLSPLTSGKLVRKLAEAGVSSLAMDMIPRITRAQSMDVLSSMSTLAGYKAVLLAAGAMVKMCPMMMTAAGTIRPASALVIGAGVAGLQAIATAKRLGAVVTAIDVRPAVKEQVESLGAKFIPMEVEHEAEIAGGYAADLGEEFYQGEQDIIAPHGKNADLIVSTARIPGRKAPVLITEKMVEQMRGGSVIVDLAAPAGGNCSLTKLGETVEHNGVKILGPRDLAAEMPVHASQMFARNVAAFLKEFITKEGQWKLDMENEVIRGTLITHEGQVVHEATRKALGIHEVQA